MHHIILKDMQNENYNLQHNYLIYPIIFELLSFRILL